MKCGYCGNSICSTDGTQSDLLPGLFISQFSYNGCSHLLETLDQNASHPWQGLQAKKALVDAQLKSIERLEMYLLNKKHTLTSQLREFCSHNKTLLKGCQKVAESFDENFKRLLHIRVEPAFKEKFHSNLQAYFNKEDLTAWSKTCLRESTKLIRKLDSLEQNLMQDLSQEIDQLLTQISLLTHPIKNKLNLHEITFKAFERDTDKRESLLTKQEHLDAIQTLQDIYQSLHVQVMTTIKMIVGDVAAFAKKTDASVSRNQYLLTNNITEVSRDSKILAIFEDFDDIFVKCTEEIKQRAKFRFVYKRVLQILNELTKTENVRRTSFMQNYSSKIPSQIFPEIRKLSKEIILEKFFEGLDEELPIETALSQKLLESLHNVRVLILAL